MKLNALIVDDEKMGRETLKDLIESYCPAMTVIGTAGSAARARSLVESHAPDVVFLDVEMPRENGFDFLAHFDKSRPFSVVFVTAYNHYAVKAIKASAVDYLLKPVDRDELKHTVEKLLDLHTGIPESPDVHQRRHDSMETLLHNLDRKNGVQRLTLHHSKGFKVVDVDSITRLQADSNYTTVCMANGENVLVSSTLKDFEEVLDPDTFFRVHKSHLINLAHLSEYSSEDGGHVVLDDGSTIEISKRRASDFFRRINSFCSSIRK